jgi:hypothetical protein
MNSDPAIRRPWRTASGLVVLCLITVGFAGPAFAAAPEQAPPLAPSQTRVWFLRQLLPGENFHPPMVYANGAPIAAVAPGTAFYRDFAPGRYTFSVENCLPQAGTSQTIDLRPDTQVALLVQQDDNGADDCVPPQVSYLRQVQPQSVPYLFAPLTYVGAR